MEEPLYYPNDSATYYIKLWVGTPAQDIFLIMDTGSNVVWQPSTRKNTCNDCNGYNKVLHPKNSSSHVPIKCIDLKCRDLCENEGCIETFHKFLRICPHFGLNYGIGNATGCLLSDTLTLPLKDGGKREIKQFTIGCSMLLNPLASVAGFGIGGLSMPSHLAPLFGYKFAYFLEYVNNISKIVFGNKAVPKDISLTYTALLLNPGNPSDFTLYYLGVEAVSIGAKHLTLPSNFMTFDG